MKWLITMKCLVVLAAILALAPLALARTSTWSSDPIHFEAAFTITHFTISNIHGRFGHVTVTVNQDKADVTESNVAATVDASAIDTSEPMHDALRIHQKFL
jgi:polyisoprenoid-binding protein YceI